MLRIAIVGCGKIADQHVAAIRRIPGCEIVAVCDREVLMAGQLGERCGVKGCYGDLAVMLAECKPDVVHITTPPQGHFALAQMCLQAGSHVYLEKPFTITAGEARQLTDLAGTSGRLITAGHNLQFTLEMLEMRRLVKAGFLGGTPSHLESHFSYGLDDASYVAPILGSRKHWVRQLPGQLLHNVVSHGIAKLAEFLDDDAVVLMASAHQSPRLRSLGGAEVLDELRVLIRDGKGTSAFFCFTTQLKPSLNLLKIYGPSNALVVDHASGCLIRNRSVTSKSYLTFIVPPLQASREYFRNARHNLMHILRHRLHQDAGMKELIARFYDSIRLSQPPPIPYREILLTARIMDDIFAQIYPPASQPENAPLAASTK